MTLRDFWEVLTFQVSWADSNIFIVLLAIIIQIFLVWFIFQWFGDLREQFIRRTFIGKGRLARLSDEERKKEKRERFVQVFKDLGNGLYFLVIVLIVAFMILTFNEGISFS